MKSKQLADRPFSEGSPSQLLVDTRSSQSLEPVRLPAKLRDRVERAQRRAAAAKDGVSIFTTDPKSGSASGPAGAASRRISTAPSTTAGVTTTATGQPLRASTANGGLETGQSSGAGNKMHLPEVVLSHKMRDFEARANPGSSAAQLLAEPPDRSLQRLSLEDRERVMLAMQSKIRQIASDVDANFVRLTKRLDANGVFDSAANVQRAQTLCLVELQRRCKLERLRDEAMREVLELPPTPRTLARAAASSAHKLSQLLSPPCQRSIDEATTSIAPKTASSTHRKRKQDRTAPKLLPTLRPARSSPTKRGSKSSQDKPTSLSPASATTGNSSGTGTGRLVARRGGLAPPMAVLPPVVREESSVVTATAGNASAREGDLYSRHPHVTQVLQLLAAGESSASSNAYSSGNNSSAEADMEHARVLDPADEWAQRSANYQAVGARAAEALHRRAERQRWDTTSHFYSTNAARSVSSVPTALRERLEVQQNAWTGDGGSQRSDNSTEVGGAGDAEKDRRNQRRRDQEVYTELQTRIRERLRASERRTRTAAAAVRVVGARGQARKLQTAPGKILPTASSQATLLGSSSSPPRGSHPLPAHAPALGVSASEPALTTAIALVSSPNSALGPSSPLLHSRPGTRARISVLEQKARLAVMADASQSAARYGRVGLRKDLLIGAPRTQSDSNAIGRHSEARIAYRRDSAQTWAWRPPPGTASSLEHGVEAIPEGAKEQDEAEDRFDEEGGSDKDEDPEGEDGEEDGEAGDDDWESVESSRAPFSARSSLSMSSVKRHANSGSRMHGKNKKPPPTQRRLSRGTGSVRSMFAGTALSGNSLTLHARLEAIWRGLQFPFSHKLVMLDRLSTLQDAGAFVSALEHWERVTPLVAIRERMKLALVAFADRGELRVSERLTPSECALVAGLTQSERVVNASESAGDIPTAPGSLTAAREFDPSCTAPVFVSWVRSLLSLSHCVALVVGGAASRCLLSDALLLVCWAVQIKEHIEIVTHQMQKLALELKTRTGEELQFQGHPYPRRV
ncbi:hypothetical protein BBJ28_00009894 [Nothophytophthora sp. Chile5]|nr:hypothetical protein BBJ28_00009894 [Nothophytophthora sp. Chile5]